MKKNFLLFCSAFLFIISCNKNKDTADAYGNFEADDIIVSSQAAGQLIRFLPDEGKRLQAGDTAAIIDTTQEYLAVQQLNASMQAIREKLPDKALSLAVYDEQIDKLQQDVQRAKNLVKNNAAPQKQLDDLQASLNLTIRKKNEAASSLNVQTQSLLAQIKPLHFQLLQAKDKLQKCYVINPVKGMALNIFSKQNEITQPGKPLYDIAPLSPIILRAYISETQLTQIKTGDSITVKADAGNGMKSFTGTVSWVSDEAEFTPKIVQTKDERANLVYAVKIEVPNDGSLKIGMPAEVYFRK